MNGVAGNNAIVHLHKDWFGEPALPHERSLVMLAMGRFLTSPSSSLDFGVRVFGRLLAHLA